MKKILIKIYIFLIYVWGCIWYDKKYLAGIYYDRNHYTQGWKWIKKYWFGQKVLGYARDIPFPIPRSVIIKNCENIVFDNDDTPNFHSNGCFYQATKAKIIIGKGTQIAPNCGLITTNHDIYDIRKHVEGKDVVIGKNCWIGMGAIILPGVVLGDHTVVGAGSIVTKSFMDGYAVICGNPAKIIKVIEREKVCDEK